jgi:hypothetical protein
VTKMSSDPFTRVISSIYDTVLAPDLWAQALQQTAEALGGVGAAYIVSNKRTRQVDWASFWGPSVEFKPDYVSYYGALDPFRPFCHATPSLS